MNKLLATPILALLFAQASMAQSPRSNVAISALPSNNAAPHAVSKPKVSTARVLSADDREVLAKAVRLYPKSLAERAAYLIKAGKPLLALSELDKLIKENPKLVEGYVAKAKIYDDLHRFDEAQVSLRKALAIQPDYQPARILLATVSIKKGDLDGAMKELGQSFGFALATKSGVAPQPEIHEARGGLLAPLAEMPGAWILQSLHMLIAPPIAIAPSTTTNADETFDGASVVQAPVEPPLPPPKLSALKPREDKPENYPRDDDKQEVSASRTPQKSTLVFTREIEPKPEVVAQPEKNNTLKFISDDDDSTIESAQLPPEPKVEPPPRVAMAPAAVPPPPPMVEASKPAPLQFSPEKLEKSGLGFVDSANNIPAATIGASSTPATVELSPPDQWTEKLKYLAEHGTAELDDGEAFMFSEDTGEATLFLANGKRVRRVIAQPRDNDVVVATRRPDVLKAEDLVYRLALLAKLMPTAALPAQPKVEAQTPVRIAAAEPKQSSSTFNADGVLGRNDGFVGWLKHLFPF